MKKLVLLMATFCTSSIVFGQTVTENYVHTILPQEPTSNVATLQMEEKIETISYYDGMGRPKQELSLRASPNKNDIVTHIEYDEVGRKGKQYLPFERQGGVSGSFNTVNILAEINSYYLNKYPEDFKETSLDHVNAYSESVFEASPLNRVIEQAAPGKDWGRTNDYTVNESWFFRDFITVETTFGTYGNPVELSVNGQGLMSASFDFMGQGAFRLKIGDIKFLSDFLPDTDLGYIPSSNGGSTSYFLSIKNGFLHIASATQENLTTVNTTFSHQFDLDNIAIGGNTIKFEHGSNTVSDGVKHYSISFLNNDTEIPQLEDQGLYESSQLFKTITKDENWKAGQQYIKDHTTEEFTDKQERVVLKRTYNEGLEHDTYYIYDNFNNLTFVVPPLASDLNDLSLSGSQSQSILHSQEVVENNDNLTLEASESIILEVGFHAKFGSMFKALITPIQWNAIDELCYQYRYDYRNRLVEKKVPGKGWEYIVYNKLDQPTMTQDPNLKALNKWLFTKYDAFGRVAYTGFSYTSATRSSLQSVFDAPTTNTHWVKRQQNAQTIAGVQVLYDNIAKPMNLNEVHTINYYDTYLPSNAQGYAARPAANHYGTEIVNNTKGLSTVGRVRVLDVSPAQWITTTTGYDKKGRTIWMSSVNDYLQTNDLIEYDLDFVGRVKNSISTHIKTGQPTITTEDTFTYDHMGRLSKQTQKINGQREELIAENTYDELGQLKSKKVGNTTTKPLQRVDYEYNIRGWLKKINDPTSLGNDLFGFGIAYNDVADPTKRLYNGNIGETAWGSKSINSTSNLKSNKYTYSYDALNRITGAVDNTGHYTLSGMQYDKNGNIDKLKRQGLLSDLPNATNFGMMDDLTYAYDGNRLLKVADAAVLDQYGFRDDAINTAPDTSNDYAYDANGNMTSDANKGITSILWNHLNMPTGVNVTSNTGDGTGTIGYIYDAIGTKIKKTAPGTVTEYAGNFIYKKVGSNPASLEFFNQPEGYVEESGGSYSYTYQYKDHLGNIRLSYSDFDLNGAIDPSTEILEEKNYYPFGLQHKGYNNVVNGTENNYQTFQGQELYEDLGINVIEFKWRTHDPAIGRFWQIDPLAEDFVYNSPYAFSENSPIAFVELEGLEKVLAIYFHGGPSGGGQPTTVGDAGYTGQYYENTQSFAQSSGREFSGTIIAPGVTSASGVETGMGFVNDNYEAGDQVIVYGYSYGVDVAVDLTESLNEAGINVDLLVTVDGSDGPLQNTTVNTDIPENVDTNLNVYQTNNSGTSSSSRSTGASSSGTSTGSSSSNSGTSNSPGSNGGPNTAVNSSKTNVVNKNITGAGVNHGNIQQKAVNTIQPLINTRVNNYPRNQN